MYSSEKPTRLVCQRRSPFSSPPAHLSRKISSEFALGRLSGKERFKSELVDLHEKEPLPTPAIWGLQDRRRRNTGKGGHREDRADRQRFTSSSLPLPANVFQRLAERSGLPGSRGLHLRYRHRPTGSQCRPASHGGLSASMATRSASTNFRRTSKTSMQSSTNLPTKTPTSRTSIAVLGQEEVTAHFDEPQSYAGVPKHEGGTSADNQSNAHAS